MLGTVTEEHPVQSRRSRFRGSCLSWDQIIIILGLAIAIGLGLQRQAWDVVALLSALIVLTLLAPMLHCFFSVLCKPKSQQNALISMLQVA